MVSLAGCRDSLHAVPAITIFNPSPIHREMSLLVLFDVLLVCCTVGRLSRQPPRRACLLYLAPRTSIALNGRWPQTGKKKNTRHQPRLLNCATPVPALNILASNNFSPLIPPASILGSQIGEPPTDNTSTEPLVGGKSKASRT